MRKRGELTLQLLALVLSVSALALADEPVSYLDRLRSVESRLVYSGPAPQDYDDEQPPADVREVRYPSGDLSLKAWLALPKNESAEPLPALVYFHGGFAFGAADFEDARPFLNAGFAVMTPMLRGENGNPGSYELLLGEVDDAVAAVQWLASQPYIDRSRVHTFGHSVGGAISALLALRADVPIAYTGGAGGLYPPTIFESWRDIVPFDVQRDEEASVRLLLGNLQWMQRPHFAFLGESDEALVSRYYAEKEGDGSESQLIVRVLPGDHFSSLPGATEAYLRIIDNGTE